MRVVSVVLLFILLSLSSEGRIGETSLQFVDRYGPPKDTKLTKITDNASPLVAGAIHHTYEYQGWKIRAAFLQLDGPAVRVDFQKMSGHLSGIVIRDDELQAIASANTPPSMSWSKVLYDNSGSPNRGLAKLAEGFAGEALGQKMFQRSDGTILWNRSNLIVRLELPAARERDAQLKIAKEQKARASIPQF